MFATIDEDDSKLIDMVEIARAIILTAKQTIEQIEFETLETIFSHLQESGLTKKLRELAEYFNFKRDFSMVPAQFTEMIRQNFEIDDKLLSETMIKFLSRRYVVIKVNGDQKIPIVFYLPLYQEIGLRRKGIKFQDQRLCKMMEHMYMAMYCEDESMGGAIEKIQAAAAPDKNAITPAKWTDMGRGYRLVPTLYAPEEWAGALKRLGKENNRGAYDLDTIADGLKDLQMKDFPRLHDDVRQKLLVACRRDGRQSEVMTLFTTLDEIDGD